MLLSHIFIFFFFNDTATTEIYTLSPTRRSSDLIPHFFLTTEVDMERAAEARDAQNRQLGDRGKVSFNDVDRKSTRLNSSHSQISYAVFCLKKKKKANISTYYPTKSQYNSHYHSM